MAIAVIDRLEVVEVDQQQGDRLAMAFGVGQGGFAALDQVAAVGQLGQRVVEGGMLQFVFTLT